jgi:hypothetical protein
MSEGLQRCLGSPGLLLGADLLYDLLNIDPLVDLLTSMLPGLPGRSSSSSSSKTLSKQPVAYLATTLRQKGTFDLFETRAHERGLVLEHWEGGKFSEDDFRNISELENRDPGDENMSGSRLLESRLGQEDARGGAGGGGPFAGTSGGTSSSALGGEGGKGSSLVTATTGGGGSDRSVGAPISDTNSVGRNVGMETGHQARFLHLASAEGGRECVVITRVTYPQAEGRETESQLSTKI